jgi:hypothetical protein
MLAYNRRKHEAAAAQGVGRNPKTQQDAPKARPELTPGGGLRRSSSFRPASLKQEP